MGGHIDATWRIRLNRPSAAAMRRYVKLLSPLVSIVNHPARRRSSLLMLFTAGFSRAVI